MKKITFLLLAVVTIFFFTSCEENFSPKTDFKEKVVLNFIVRGDTSFQSLTLLKSYDVPGYDAYVNTEDPFLYAADVRMWQGDDVHVLQPGLKPRSDTSRYKEPIKYYYTNNFKPSENDSLEIRVVLNDGKMLRAGTRLPELSDYAGDKNLPVEGSEFVNLRWIGNTNYTNYLPRFLIRYKVTKNNITEVKHIVVPMDYVTEKGKKVPLYPKLSSNKSLPIKISALDSAFRKISEGDPVKERYTIVGGVLQLVVLDDNLSRYFSSLNGFLDDYTIRLDESDYSNVSGGLGIFGSMIQQELFLGFRQEFITSYGYKVNVSQ